MANGWGRFPLVDACITHVESDVASIEMNINSVEACIPAGNYRSYGDSALNSHILSCNRRNYFLGFDASLGVLHVQSGVLLSDIVASFVPRGWFLNVTPGTKLVTVGGAIASDVHGKNHHVAGCFSASVVDMRVMLANGDVVVCRHGDALFHATCGGMGLTGVILDARIALKKINSQYVAQTTIKVRNLNEMFQQFEANAGCTYSVAWIDCLASNDDLGRGLLMLGEFADDGDLAVAQKKRINIPFNFPSFALNTWSVRAFNWLYYQKAPAGISEQKVSIDQFFYPLDAIENWNRIYGKNGFVQYQFILPKEVSYEGLHEILAAIAQSGRGSFLAVLKLYGEANENYLSFPMSGYSLALDFKIDRGLFAFLNQLDEIVVRYGGRIYLAKDARVSKDVFAKGYPLLGKFKEYRKTIGADKKFQSLQSKRIDI